MSNTMNRVTRLMQNTAAVFKRSYTFEEAISANGDKAKGHNWIFPPDTLIHGQIEFAVRFLGDRPVQQSKGIEVTKEAVQQLRFNLQLKRSHGQKLQKVLLQISINGVNILDYKSKRTLHQHPLHRISFCADDKQDKRVFAYIVKRGAESNEHDCFVFLCNKMAEQITLTVGEAFDLAYRRFLENNGRDLEVKKQLIILRKRIQELEEENSELKGKLAGQQRALSRDDGVLMVNGISGKEETTPAKSEPSNKNWESFDEQFTPVQMPSVPTSPVPPPPIPARPSLLEKPLSPTEMYSDPFTVIDPLKNPLQAMAKVSEPLEPTKVRAEPAYDPEFDPRAEECNRQNAFGMFGTDNEKPSSQMYDNAIRQIDLRLADLREGFSQGISFANDDFRTIADLDPFPPVNNVSKNLATMSEETAKAVWKRADAVCFDVDSTVCVGEFIDDLAAHLGKQEEIAALTAKAMEGSMPFQQSLQLRLDVLKPSRTTVERFIQVQPIQLTTGIETLIRELQRRSVQVYLVSGGFSEYVSKVAKLLRIPSSNSYANRLIYNADGSYSGFDKSQPTATTEGKRLVCQELKDRFKYKRLIMVGDGMTDAYASPPADAFIGFGGNQVRPSVVAKAHWFVYSFQELTDALG